METKNIRISKQPNFIIVTIFESEDTVVFYHLDVLVRNKFCDVGVWKIKYKK